MSGFKSFEDLEFWKEGRLFRNSISDLVNHFPKEEQYRLKDQLVRSSRSITANIAEGHGRFHYQENIQYCRIARGSITESLDHLIVAFDEKYIKKEELEKQRNHIESLMKLANGYIAYLKKRKSE